ncbi:carboxypeptidase-like regulatory domain-containing protein [Allosphingosinicella vermicomposti]|uniref:carboxypeptidase-like regulatory domain-containing protein n=1 Tax=Allosphingosinicella vermicomposti TaxID=614671 RepID=UPI000D107E4C|nr:carboxypeptidase-like regulatory domain-containing protein [Allosphingosinicella vermicomposti]
MTYAHRLTYPALMAAALISCGVPAASNAAPYYVQGRVVDSQGKPLKGAKVVMDVYNWNDTNIDHSTRSYDDTDKVAITDAAGNYRVRVGDGGWRVHGSIEKSYNGDTFSLPLHPDNPNWVPGKEGGVRNMAWKLTGKIPDEIGGGFYGGTVEVVTTYESGFREESYPQVELTLEPVGPLIDGSAGTALTRKPDRDGNIKDVPIGRYRVQARLGGRPLTLRLDDNQSPFQQSTVVDFKSRGDSNWGYCINCVQIELRKR